MGKKIDSFSTGLLLLLGLVHIALTPVFYEHFNHDALWFAGSGGAFLFLGFLNLLRITNASRLSRWMCLVGNFLGLIFIVCFLLIERSLEPQGLISLLSLGILLLLSLLELNADGAKKAV